MNKPGAVVPYKKKEMYEVEGLPDGVPFQKPNAYGNLQVNKIMENKDSLKFIILDHDGILNKARKPCNKSDLVLAMKKDALKKIVSCEIVDEVMRGERTIQEDEIEVLADILPEEQQVLMKNCLSYFDKSALPLLHQVCEMANKNCSAASDDETVILPCYSDMQEDVIYWLFLTKKSLLECHEIKGKWLDRVQHLKYELWGEQESSICKDNAILRDDQFIIFKNHVNFNQSGSTVVFSSQCLIELENYIKTNLLME